MAEARVTIVVDTRDDSHSVLAATRGNLDQLRQAADDAAASTHAMGEDATAAASAAGDAADTASGQMHGLGDAAGVSADELADAGDAAEQAGEQTVDAAERSEWSWGQAALAFGGATAGLEALARSASDTVVESQRIATATELTRDEVQGLTADLSDATFAVDEVRGVLEAGAQQGLQTRDDLTSFAETVDLVADGTGESAVRLAEMTTGLRAVGVAAGDEDRALDAFGFVTAQTTQQVGDFLQFLERTGPELREVGADVDDTAALLAIMETQFGLTGRQARQEFRTAINESDGSLEGLLETLGVSQEQFEAVRGEVDGSRSVLEDNAAAVEDAVTPWERLTAEVSAFTEQHADSINAFSGMGSAAGTAVTGVALLPSALRNVRDAAGGMVRGLGRARRFLLGPWGAAVAATVGIGADLVASFQAGREEARDLADDVRDAAATSEEAAREIRANLREHLDDTDDLGRNLARAFETGLGGAPDVFRLIRGEQTRIGEDLQDVAFAWQLWREEADTAADSTQDVVARVERLRDMGLTQDATRTPFWQLGQDVLDTTGALDDFDDSATTAADALATIDAAAADARTSVDMLDDALAGLFDDLDAEQAAIRARDAIRAIGDEIDRLDPGEVTFELGTEVGDRLVDQVISAGQTARDALAAELEAGAEFDAAMDGYRDRFDELVDELVDSAGIARGEAEDLAEAYFGVPTEIESEFFAETEQARRDALDLIDQYGIAAEDVETLLDADASDADAEVARILDRYDGLSREDVTTLLEADSGPARSEVSGFLEWARRQRTAITVDVIGADARRAIAGAEAPGRAAGGPVSRVPYLVGEEGPELWTPPAAGWVHDASTTQRILSEPPAGVAALAGSGGVAGELAAIRRLLADRQTLEVDGEAIARVVTRALDGEATRHRGAGVA